MSDQPRPKYVPAETGKALWGPGDLYTFLVTGEESGGALFIVECLVRPGGGPPAHTHQHEEEAFYLLEGSVTLVINGLRILVGPGDFVHVPKKTVHSFTNEGAGPARMIATFAPAGMEGWFGEAYDEATDRHAPAPPLTEAMLARMLEAAPKYGVEFV